MPLNCEHVVPQSWFGKREPMRGDLHHLFACEPRCNSFRGNLSYASFGDEKSMSGCGQKRGDRFEPLGGKGAVARATLYFLVRYPGEITQLTPEQLTLLRTWSADDPPADHELHRNQAIFEVQGNRNPFIDHPEWAPLVAFERGLG
ncbi:MAG: endonuclease [Polyangiaceae bacterium]